MQETHNVFTSILASTNPMSGPGKWKKYRWKGSKEPVIADTLGVQMKRRKRKVVPSTEVIYTECAVDSRDETGGHFSVAVPEVVPVFREAAPTTTQDSTHTSQPDSEDDITTSHSSDTAQYVDDYCLKPNYRSANTHTSSTLHSEDSLIHNPACHGADDLSYPLSMLTPIPNVSSKFDSSLLTRKSIILRHDSAPLLAVAHIDPSPSSHVSDSMSQDADNDSVISDSEKSQDTVILSPSSQDIDLDDEPKPLLTSMITPMPTFYSDLLTSVRAKKSKLFPQDTTLRQLNSNEESNVSAALNSQDTLIINPAWQDSQEEFEALPCLTPMPSVYSELQSSFRTNETIMAHRNLTLLLATTRIAISHDETRLSQLDMDVSRLKRELQVKATTFDRLASRSMYIRKTVSALCE